MLAAGDSGAMLAGALLSAGAPEADVIFGIDNTTATRAEEPLLSPVSPPGSSGCDPATGSR